MGDENSKKASFSKFWRYPKIFWDDPDVAKASPYELKMMLEKWRSSDSEAYKIRLRDFVRRMSQLPAT